METGYRQNELGARDASARRLKMLLGATLAAAVLILVGIVVAASRGNSLRYTVVFSESKNLREGDRVQLAGIDVGKVEKVELGGDGKVRVGVKIDPPHREKVDAKSTALIAAAGGTSAQGVQIYNPSELSGPMADGAVAEGRDGRWEVEAWRLGQKIEAWSRDLESASKQLGKTASELAGSAKEWTGSPEAQKVVADLKMFFARLGLEAQQNFAALKAEWGVMMERLGPAIEELRRKGEEKFAAAIEQIIKQIEERMRAMEKTPAEGLPAEEQTISI